MATPVRSNTRSEFCKSSQEALLKGDVLEVWEDCPICLKRGVLCEVGCHPSTSSGHRDGKATKVAKSAKQISVFFKAGDYTNCVVVCGMGEPQLITLAT